MITLRNREEISKMKKSGELLAACHKEISTEDCLSFQNATDKNYGDGAALLYLKEILPL